MVEMEVAVLFVVVVYGLMQYAGLVEDVFDYWFNCCIVWMNVVNWFLYLNMNYHIEYYMFLIVLYY